MLELFDAEEKILVDLAVRDASASQTLLHGGIYESAGSRRALARPIEDLLYDGATFLSLHPALFDQTVNYLLDPLAGSGGGAYLQEYQAFQRFKHKVLLTL